MPFGLTDDQVLIRDTIQKFVRNEILPLEPVLIKREISGGHGASPGLSRAEQSELQEKAAALGFWGIDTPAEHGGADLDPVTLAIIHIELGRSFVDFSFPGSVLPALFSCNEEQSGDYLYPALRGERTACIGISEPSGGSDARTMQTRATYEDGIWTINGEKSWITHGSTADFCILFAATQGDGGEAGITCFLVDRDQGWVSHPAMMMGSKDKVASLFFDNVRISDKQVLGTVNEGFAHMMPFIYRNRAYILSAKVIGSIERLLEMAIAWSQERVVFGKRLSERESVSFAIAEMEIELRAAKLLLLHAAARAANNQDYRHEACSVKLHVARLANRVADKVLQIHGAMGYSKESAVERFYRDLRVERIYDGSDEVNLASVSRNLYRGYNVVGSVY